MIWVIFAWVVAVVLAVVVVLTAGLGVWRSVKVLTEALGDVGEHAAAAADQLSAVSSAVGPGEQDDNHPSRREPSRPSGRTMHARRRRPVGRGR